MDTKTLRRQQDPGGGEIRRKSICLSHAGVAKDLRVGCEKPELTDFDDSHSLKIYGNDKVQRKSTGQPSES